MYPLFDFAFWPQFYPKILDELAYLAQEEDWDYRYTQSSKHKPILVSYLNYTFKRLLEEDKIVKQQNQACFNTGLVTDNQEDIFAFFEPNDHPANQWKFKQFLKESHYLMRGFDPLPDRASY